MAQKPIEQNPGMVRQTMFTTGEVDVTVWKRTDIGAYLTAAQSLLNMECGTTGLAKKRKGTKWLANVTTLTSPNSQIYEMVDKNNNYYLILSADESIGWSVFTVDGSSGDITFHQTIMGIPYGDDILQQIDYVQTDDVFILTHPDFQPARIFVSDYSVNPPTFAWQYLNINLAAGNYPTLDFGVVDYSAAVAVFAYTNPAHTEWSLVLTDATGFNSHDFGQPWVGGQIVSFGDSAEQPIGYGTITGVNATVPGQVTFSGYVNIQFADPAADMPNRGSQYSIRQPTWSDPNTGAKLGWPAKCFFYQNRLWLANTFTLPQTIFGSKINQPLNFSVGVGNDADAIVYTLGESDSGAILWLNGGKQFEIYTKNFEFVCPQNEGIAITPSTFAVRQQSSYGSSFLIKPLTYINDSYFVIRSGKSIVNFHFTGVGLAYQASNVSLASQHLVKNPINRAIVRGDNYTGNTPDNQDNFIYYLNTDYTVTSFQFSNEFKLASLTPFEFDGTMFDNDGNEVDVQIPILDITSINNRMYFLKKYTLSGVTQIERFYELIETDIEGSDFLLSDLSNFLLSDGSHFLLSGGQGRIIYKIDGYIEVGMGAPTNALSLITGLSQFNGYIVQIIFNNQDFGFSLDAAGNEAVVTGGQCYVFNPDGDVGTVQVGLLYDAEVTPMYLFAGANRVYDFKNINRIFVDYYQTLDFKVNGYQVPFQTFEEIQAGIPITPSTDTAIFGVQSGWARFSTFSITQSSPFDLQILGIAYQIESSII